MVNGGWLATLLPDGRVRVERDGRALTGDAVLDGATVWVWLESELFELSPRSASRGTAARGASTDDALMPQMSAKVIRVLVTPGQHVNAGDTLVVLEAMKMEMPIRAPRPAEVASVNCAEGDLVQPGTPVVTLKESEPTPADRPRREDAQR